MPVKKLEIHGPKIYSETIVDPGYWLIAFLVVCFVGLVGYGLCVGENGYWDSEDRGWLLLWSLLSAVPTLYFLCFSVYKISATTSAITVRLGMFKRVVPWEDIIDCNTEIIYYWTGGGPYWTGSRYERYRGIILPIKKSKRKLVYRFYYWRIYLRGWRVSRKIGRRHVVLRLRRGGIEEFSFPTRKPKALVGVIKGQIGKQEKQETIA